MSNKGKLSRGEKWWNNRNIDGALPENITKDPNKMKDVEFYLESIKPKVKK